MKKPLPVPSTLTYGISYFLKCAATQVTFSVQPRPLGSWCVAAPATVVIAFICGHVCFPS